MHVLMSLTSCTIASKSFFLLTTGRGVHIAKQRGLPQPDFVYEILNLQKFSEIPVHFHVIPLDSIRFRQIPSNSVSFWLG